MYKPPKETYNTKKNKETKYKKKKSIFALSYIKQNITSV